MSFYALIPYPNPESKFFWPTKLQDYLIRNIAWDTSGHQENKKQFTVLWEYSYMYQGICTVTLKWGIPIFSGQKRTVDFLFLMVFDLDWQTEWLTKICIYRNC